MINEGDFVVIKRDELMSVVQVKGTGRTVKFDRHKFKLDNIIGTPYGGQWTVDKSSGQLLPSESLTDPVLSSELVVESGADNRNLVGANEDNQNLDKDSINALKKQGLSGEEVMGELIKNSSTFTMKTKFSQEKWIKKKKKRHLAVFTFMRPCTRLIAEIYFRNDPARIGMDSLAQILAYSNISHKSKVLLVESCQGLVAGAILERLSDAGKLVQLFTNPNPMKGRNAFDDFGFPPELQKERMKIYPLNHLHELDPFKPYVVNEKPVQPLQPQAGDEAVIADVQVPAAEDEDEPVTKKAKTDSATLPADGEPSTSNDSPEELAEGKADGQIDELSTSTLPAYLVDRQLTKEYICANRFDSVVVAVKASPTPIALMLLELLKIGGQLVVYHQRKEPLVELFIQLKERGGIINMRLSETWLREIQVLPERTHPVVNMSGTGGYLLIGTIVEL